MESQLNLDEYIKANLTVLKPIRNMRSPPSLTGPKSIQTSPDSMTRYLKRIIKKQCRIYQKVSNILSDTSPPLFNTSSKVPVKTSRLSPFLFNHAKLKPLPSSTPQPKIKKTLKKIEEKSENQQEDISNLSISTKLLNIRFQKRREKKKIEIGIGTKDQELLEEDFFSLDEDEEETDDLGRYYLNKACL